VHGPAGLSSHAGGPWSIEVVELLPSTEANVFPSIAMDGTGAVHVAYTALTTLRYARRPATGGWTVAVVDTVRGTGNLLTGYTSTSVDAGGGLHVGYWDYVDPITGVLRYAHRPAGGAWTTETVAQSASIASSFAADASGAVHASYALVHDNTHADLRYAYRSTAGTWTTRSLDDTGDGSAGHALVVDARGPSIVAGVAVTSGGAGPFSYFSLCP
jgi:hypothetical protein